MADCFEFIKTETFRPTCNNTFEPWGSTATTWPHCDLCVKPASVNYDAGCQVCETVSESQTGTAEAPPKVIEIQNSYAHCDFYRFSPTFCRISANNPPPYIGTIQLFNKSPCKWESLFVETGIVKQTVFDPIGNLGHEFQAAPVGASRPGIELEAHITTDNPFTVTWKLRINWKTFVFGVWVNATFEAQTRQPLTSCFLPTDATKWDPTFIDDPSIANPAVVWPGPLSPISYQMMPGLGVGYGPYHVTPLQNT